MRHLQSMGLLALGIVVWLAQPSAAHAQYRGRGGYAPSVSPYLGLTTPGGSMNYFTIVRPELEFRNLINRQNSQIQELERRAKEAPRHDDAFPKQEEFTLPKTGHRVYFSNTSRYYPAWR